jgi:DNA-binding winged helix-turn-helix (wHTH) protein
VLELLVLLVRRRSRALTKAELMARIWPDTVVEENNLTVSVSILRKALGESGSERRYIETLPRRGYRFVAEVRTVENDVTEAVTDDGRPCDSRLPAFRGAP